MLAVFFFASILIDFVDHSALFFGEIPVLRHPSTSTALGAISFVE